MESGNMALTTLFTGPQWRRCAHSQGEGEGGTNGESHVDARAAPRVT